LHRSNCLIEVLELTPIRRLYKALTPAAANEMGVESSFVRNFHRFRGPGQQRRCYFPARIAVDRIWNSMIGISRRWTMRKISSNTRLHDTRALGGRFGERIQGLAGYGALAVIAAIVFGTLSTHPF
jgi:hypothetical protein